MFDLSRFLLRVERRARRIRAFRRAGPLLAGIAALAFLTQLLLHYAFRLSLGQSAVLAAISVLLVLFLVSYLVFRAQKVRIPEMLLRIDHALGLDARLSSLYELRRRAGNRVFRAQIEKRLTGKLDAWKRGLPLGKRAWLGAAAFTVLLAAIFGFSHIPVPEAAESPTSQIATTPAGTVQQAEDAAPTGSSSVSEAVGTATSRETETPTSSPSREDVRLDNTLDQLGNLDTPDALAGDTGLEELGDLMARQQEAARALSEMIEEMREQMRQQQQQELTQEQRQQLREQMNEGLAPETEQALRDLLSETDPDTLQDLLDELAESLAAGVPAEMPDDTPDEQSERPSLEIALDNPEDWEAPQQSPAESSDQESADSQGSPEQGEGNVSPSGDDGADASQEGETSPDLYGDSAGIEGNELEDLESEDQEANFTSEEPPFVIGDEGEFSDFISKGVPIETLPEERDSSLLDSISFERIDSILGARGLSDDAVDAVREYFTRITQGGS